MASQSNNMPDENEDTKPIATFVFCDLETTSGVNQKEGIQGIVELSMVAVNRLHFIKTPPNELPRVQHRLLLCFNPNKTISEKSMNLTQLSNALLEQQAPFDKNTCEMINGFIKCLPKPVCLIAHSGLKHHYPILLHHMQSSDVNMEANVKCTDSLYAFYDLYGINRVAKTKKYTELIRHRFYQNTSEIPKEKFLNLADIYEREVQTPLSDCSKSQSQSFYILKIALIKAEQFADWIDRNHCNLSEVPVVKI